RPEVRFDRSAARRVEPHRQPESRIPRSAPAPYRPGVMVFPMKSSVLDRISRLGKVSALFAFAALVSACGAGSEREARIEFVTLRLTPALDARDREALADLLVAP